jgi:hypothetical protein
MGIDIQLYRAQIGNFHARGHFIFYSDKLNHMILIHVMLSCGLIFLIFLLLILCGDIEQNPGPDQIINGFLLNARSIKSVNQQRNKIVELQSLASIKDATIICLTETWLTKDIADSEILPSNIYNIYRKDRDGRGGGVLTAVKFYLISKKQT